jgi:fatty-acyl-CoA synthase
MAEADDAERFIDADENAAAALCYTSGTTGDPKGVLYTHRSLYLHSVGICMADSLAISECETVLPVVPMFHANAWGIPYACALTGASLVLPGPHVVGKPLADLIESERVTLTAGVPSVYTVLHQYLRQHPHDISSLRSLVIGGSAAPAALIEAWRRDFGVPVIHAWGMTELSPVGAVCRLRASMQDLEPAEQLPILAKQGIPVPMVEADVLDESGAPAPWDGKTTGELVVRGPWVARAYYKEEGAPSPLTDDGWFRTGDVARIDPQGYVELTDRKKDVIKSRGEWISSVEMENAVMGMPGVLEAAVIGRPHALRGEVAAAFVVRRSGTEPITGADVRDHLAATFARWQLPRLKDIHFVDALPKTGTGKFDKKALRAGLQAS